jgi:hypothetical protein
MSVRDIRLMAKKAKELEARGPAPDDVDSPGIVDG